MRTRTTRGNGHRGRQSFLHMAFELGHRKRRVRFGDGQRARDVGMPARDQARLLVEIGRTRAKFGLPVSCLARSCYSVGWDGLWVDRFLRAWPGPIRRVGAGHLVPYRQDRTPVHHGP